MRRTLTRTASGIQPQVIDPARARRSGYLLLGLALTLALIAGLASYAFMHRLQADVQTTRTVVVAAVPIPANTTISADMLIVRQIPDKYFTGFFLSTDDLLDGTTTALIDIAEGDYIQQSMVTGNAGLPPGYRATGMSVDAVTGGSVQPGNEVDIIASFIDQEGQATTRRLMQKVRVLAVDSLLPDTTIPGQTYQPPDATGRLRLAPDRSVILALTPQQVLELAHAEQFADDVRLVVRRLDEPLAPELTPVQFIGNRIQGLPPGTHLEISENSEGS